MIDFSTVLKFLLVIALGIVGFNIGRKEIGDDQINEALLFFYAISKAVYICRSFLIRIRETANDHLKHTDIISFIGYNALLLVLSYGVDYLTLFEIDPQSFAGITTHDLLIPHITAFLYYSISVFSTAGFGDVLPKTVAAQLLASSQMMLSWFLTILVIANFGTIRAAFKKAEAEKDGEEAAD
ncbi:MAG: two pore domain potassium channel family protein [Sphingobacteriales bacterium]|nr:MAG: two pore domain potassium channel family protein [Sphingobacteriales bacterium]